ncbi:MAG: flagellar motor switch protein FliG [Methylocystis sp.]|nr:flagellar motor switch protein FliG [Methylocystis sp.]MCA3583756.1 flagellar motor switch protein FliG [Methylocystis sp.]MCA3586429.1 flagellar motor switch protein FliG [Methylocystis sp.]MCA3589970.1 flagellar motor switch protein FliG [Methylocystis sp.]
MARISDTIASERSGLSAPGTTRQRVLSGAEKAAIIMLVLGEKHGAKVWPLLDDDEIRTISLAMSQLGSIDAPMVETLISDFVSRMSSSGAVTGDFDRTESLLVKLLPKDRAESIMAEIRGPAGRNMWQKLSNIQDAVLANYLKNEYPQTVAVILSKIKPDQAARVLGILPDDFAMDVVQRMLKMEAVSKDVLERVEETLRNEFISNLSMSSRRDSHELIAEIFNAFDRQTEVRFLGSLDERNRDSAQRIRSLMFTFDDLLKLDPGSVQTLLRGIDKETLAMALKGASEQARAFFLGNMSTRAAKNLEDDMGGLGPVRLKEVDDAQQKMVLLTKDLAAKGELMISKNRAEDELVY